MPILDFALSNFSYYSIAGKKTEQVIRYKLTNADRKQELIFRDGEELLDRPANLSIRSNDNLPDFTGALGAVHYLPAYSGSDDGVIQPSPPSLSVEYLMSDELIRQIFESEVANFGPTTIRVSVDEGIGYGWAPDGSNKVWESENNHVPISSVSLIWLRSENGDQ